MCRGSKVRPVALAVLEVRPGLAEPVVAEVEGKDLAWCKEAVEPCSSVVDRVAGVAVLAAREAEASGCFVKP
jgi:hypothetical protein